MQMWNWQWFKVNLATPEKKKKELEAKNNEIVLILLTLYWLVTGIGTGKLLPITAFIFLTPQMDTDFQCH